MAGFFSKKQYAEIADKELAIKLLNERCLECSILLRTSSIQILGSTSADLQAAIREYTAAALYTDAS